MIRKTKAIQSKKLPLHQPCANCVKEKKEKNLENIESITLNVSDFSRGFYL